MIAQADERDLECKRRIGLEMEAREAGMNAHLAKPLKIEDIASTLAVLWTTEP